MKISILGYFDEENITLVANAKVKSLTSVSIGKASFNENDDRQRLTLRFFDEELPGSRDIYNFLYEQLVHFKGPVTIHINE